MMKYAIFDMDGTLTDSMGVWEVAPYQLLRRYGKEGRPDLRPRLMQLTQEDGCRLMQQEYGIDLPLAVMMEDFYDVVGKEYRKVQLKPGVIAALEQMKKRGIPMAIASSTRSQTVREVLEQKEILPYFAGIFSCKDGRGKKVCTDVYLDALHGLGGSDPAEAWVFEDASHAAISAKRGGFPVMGVYDRYCEASPEEMKRICDGYLRSWNDFVMPE